MKFKATFYVLLLIVVVLMACEDVTKMSKKAMKVAQSAKQQTTEIAVNTVKAAEQKVDTAITHTEQQLDSTTQQVTNAINSAVLTAVEQLKTWIYEVLTPIFPWIFIATFIIFFAALKLTIPLGHLAIVQLPLSLISFTAVFWLYAKIGLASFAIKGLMYMFFPIIAVALLITSFRNYLVPKLYDLNLKLKSKLSNQTIT